MYETIREEKDSTEKATTASSTRRSDGVEGVGSPEPEAPTQAVPTAQTVEMTVEVTAEATEVAEQAGVEPEEPEEPDLRLDQTHLTSPAGPAGPTILTRRGPRRRERDVQRSCARLARYEEVVRLHQLGWSQYAIAKQMDMSRKTVARWLSKGSFPEYKYPAVRHSKVDSYTGYLRERWEQGCHNGRQLLDELRAQGYRGGRTIVREHLSNWRERAEGANANSSGEHRDRRQRNDKKLERPRQLRWLLLKKVDELDDDDYQRVMKLCQCSQDVTLAYGLVTDF